MEHQRPPTPVGNLEARFSADVFLYYPRLRVLASYVRAHLGEHLSLKRGAKVVGLEKKYFSTFFRSKVGITWTEWVRILRVTRAAEQIQLREESMASIAFAAGFRDIRTFERAFKRYVGMPPKAYQASVRPKSRVPRL